MSIKMMDWVWSNSPAKGSHRLVLLALADSANDDGICWPSIATVAKKANLSRRYVINILNELQQGGLIQVKKRRIEEHKNSSNVYRVVRHGSPPEIAGSEAGLTIGSEAGLTIGSEAGLTIGSEAAFTSVVRRASPKPSINRNIEPSLNTPAAQKKLQSPQDPLFDPDTPAGQARILTVEAMHRGACMAEELRTAVEKTFHIYVPWQRKTGKAFLQFLVEHQNGQTVELFGKWWYGHDWRGKTGQPPTIDQVMQLWPQAFLPHNNGGVEEFILPYKGTNVESQLRYIKDNKRSARAWESCYSKLKEKGIDVDEFIRLTKATADSHI